MLADGSHGHANSSGVFQEADHLLSVDHRDVESKPPLNNQRHNPTRPKSRLAEAAHPNPPNNDASAGKWTP
jgi:hypothetical protein